MRHDAILRLDRVSKSFGGLSVVEDLSFTVRRGSRTALIGPNGAGKTTVFNLISGVFPRNSVVADILTVLHERSLRFWFIAFADDLQLRRIDDEHRAILSAIKQRTRAEAEAAMRAHIESSRNHIMRAI
jgi:ABC-type sugar transport system ATPase subunit